MPKNPVTDPITDQEIAFACLILSGAMNDRRAAEAVGLDPSTATYTKSTPRVRAYMMEHRAAVSEKPIDQDVEGPRPLNIGRDQILARLWHLANLNPQETRGSMAGQIKALSMIIAIEGLIPSRFNDRRVAPVPAQPSSPPVQARIYVSEWMRPKSQTEAEEPAQAMAGAEAQPAAPQVPDPPLPEPTEDALPNLNRNPASLDSPSHDSEEVNQAVMGRLYDADLHPAGPLRLPIPPWKNAFARGR